MNKEQHVPCISAEGGNTDASKHTDPRKSSFRNVLGVMSVPPPVPSPPIPQGKTLDLRSNHVDVKVEEPHP